MIVLQQFIISGILFLLTLAFGVWLSHVGKPYNGLLFNIHKLIALACVVLLGVQLSKMLQAPDGQMVVLLVVSALCVIALFVTGAMMSAGKLDYALMLTIHRVAPGALALCCALTLYFLTRKP